MTAHENSTELQDETALKEPSLYSVFLLNDDFTTQEFVTQVLIQFFQKSPEEAHKIMLNVHMTGKGLAGTYTKEVAETKVYFVKQAAKENEFPLKCVMEEA